MRFADKGDLGQIMVLIEAKCQYALHGNNKGAKVDDGPVVIPRYSPLGPDFNAHARLVHAHGRGPVLQ